MQPNPVPPHPLAMVICDLVWRDPTTGKTTILGTFSDLMAPAFPVAHPTMGLYLALTGGHGRVSIRLRLIDVDEALAPLFQAETEVEFADPRSVVELGLQMNRVIFPGAGEYRFQAFAGSDFLIERRIVVKQSSGAPR